jgi:hypothetical protein
MRFSIFNMHTLKTAALMAVLSLSVHSAPPDNATNAVHYWAFDRSDPPVVRSGDVWAAARVEMANETVRLLIEVDGKLTAYWESRAQACWKTVKRVLERTPRFIPAADGAFVNGKAIRSFTYREDKAGKATYELKGVVAELGSVSDPTAIKLLEEHLTALDPTLPH